MLLSDEPLGWLLCVEDSLGCLLAADAPLPSLLAAEDPPEDPLCRLLGADDGGEEVFNEDFELTTETRTELPDIALDAPDGGELVDGDALDLVVELPLPLDPDTTDCDSLDGLTDDGDSLDPEGELGLSPFRLDRGTSLDRLRSDGELTWSLDADWLNSDCERLEVLCSLEPDDPETCELDGCEPWEDGFELSLGEGLEPLDPLETICELTSSLGELVSLLEPEGEPALMLDPDWLDGDALDWLTDDADSLEAEVELRLMLELDPLDLDGELTLSLDVR